MIQQAIAKFPEVFAMGDKAFAPVAAVLKTFKPMLEGKFQLVEYYLLALFIVTGVMKVLSPGSLKAMWRTMPGWAWTLGGAFELVASYFCIKGELELALPMFYVFLGAVIAQTLGSMATIMITPFPLSTVGCVYLYGLDKGVESAAWVVPCMAVGVVGSSIIGNLGTAPAKSKRN